MPSCAAGLIRLLEERGVDHVFGIPGVHTLELYRALGDSRIRHVSARHEQGAGFMADGYARMTGKPGVCLVITGPGLSNIATAMAQALADSIPMLVISTVNRTHHLGKRQGRLHELPSQAKLAESVSLSSETVTQAGDLTAALGRAYHLLERGRPGPVHIQIPVDVLAAPMDTPGALPACAKPPAPDPGEVAACCATIRAATSPLIIVGGGAVRAGSALRRLAERLDAPVVNTVNAKGVLPSTHPLATGGSPSSPWLRQEIAAADVVLAVGTELGETDFDFHFLGDMPPPGRLIRIDIDEQQLHRNCAAEHALLGDAAQTLDAIDRELGSFSASRRGAARVAAVVERLRRQVDARYAEFFACIRRELPDVLIVGDSTQPAYFAGQSYETDAPRRYFHAASGYGTLGYAIPAAIGAQLGAPEASVVCLVGDGGAQFTIAELACAVEMELPIVFIVWNNFGYGEIRRWMQAAGQKNVGVDLHAPDFQLLGRAYGCTTAQPADLAQFRQALRSARVTRGPALIEIVQDRFADGCYAPVPS
jgi:acetolactate synthase I/II/III large subunit